MTLSISVLIITKNEENQMGRCLESLVWADEIIVIDGLSTDRTVEICQDLSKPWAGKVQVYPRKWTGFKDQRNYALRQAQFDWVLVVDADEACSPELAEKVRSLLKGPKGPDFQAYQVRRIEYLLGKPISHGMWNPSYQDRFFNKTGVSYINEVHEYPVFNYPAGVIHEPLHHWPYLTPQKILEKINFYTTIEAQNQYREGKRTNCFHLVATFPAMALKTYFYYGSYKDGIHGLVVALLEGISRLIKHIKIWQLQLEDEREKKGSSLF